MLNILGFAFNVIWFYIVLVVWIAIAFWPARVAARRGRSFIGYFVLSLLFFPLALLLAYILPSRAAAQPAQSAADDTSTQA